MGEHNAVVAVYNTYTEVEAAIQELKRATFDIANLSIVGKDYHTEEHVVGHCNTGDQGERRRRADADLPCHRRG